MKSALVAVALGLSSVAVAAPLSTITPPAGWTEAKADQAVLDSIGREEGVKRTDGRQWAAPSGDAALIILELDSYHEDISTHALFETLEQGVSSGASRQAKSLSKTRQTRGHAVVVDEILDSSGVRLHMRRIYAADAADVVHLVSATCSTAGGQPSPACEAALETLGIQVEAVAFESGGKLVYRLGKYALGGLAVVLLIAFIVSKRRR